MARPLESEYVALGPYDEEEETDESDLANTAEEEVLIHVCTDNNKGNWNHIEDLDDFFTRVYSYHQRGGFVSMVLQDIFQLVQFVFICGMAYFFSECVRYDMLFNKDLKHKVTLNESFLSADQCFHRLGAHWYTVCLVIVCMVISIFYLAKIIISVFKYAYIRNFYINALKITADELPNKTWHEVQGRLLEVQKEHHMCVHKSELNQLDIYHRILRFKNYLVAMVNVNALPVKHDLPFLGEYCYLSTALRFNLDCILFWHWGPGAPFENNWHLKSEFRHHRNKGEATKQLEKRIFWFGMINLIFSPLIFIWNCLYHFFRYAEMIKHNPSLFGARRWSNYSRLYLRHFNELDHELNTRLKKGYKPVTDYMSIFTSSVTVILAKNLQFICGSILAVFLVLTVIDEDVIGVENMLAIVTGLGFFTAACRAVIPDEHTVHSPELLLRNVAMAIHYMPEHWAGNAHTSSIRDAFANLFPFKIACILEELVSPLVTPFILLFCLRPRAGSIVDFLRMFTVEVVGVGDICSFAQMDIRKHGNSKWQMPGMPPVTQGVGLKNQQQAENGKTEMSLMHFHMTNPEWKPDPEGNVFINNLKSQVQRDFASRSMMVDGGMHSMVSPSLMLPSLVPLQPVGPYTSMMSSLNGPLLPPSSAQHPHSVRLKGGLSHLEGPVARPANTSLFASLHSSTVTSSSDGALADSANLHTSITPHSIRKVDECTRELMSNEMNINALFMHEMRWRRANNDYLSLEDYARAVWQSPDGSTVGSSVSAAGSSMFPMGAGGMSQGGGGGGGALMPSITEEGSADEKEVDTSRNSPPLHYQADSARNSPPSILYQAGTSPSPSPPPPPPSIHHHTPL